ncbi:hypothetical protein DERF_014859 [Dermatophagoides farinae]|uniref:Uncharacterized protein n=1 Tax=Dermatophagoides farinae TaxID=6954 RepID=A0A922HJX7_DERFA|nr:hypothetical protein DERF_014859 [Dermatophagoides farinae]
MERKQQQQCSHPLIEFKHNLINKFRYFAKKNLYGTFDSQPFIFNGWLAPEIGGFSTFKQHLI